MIEPVIMLEKKDRLAIVTLNRPQAMNALSSELIAAISETFSNLQKDPSVGAVILTGAGKAFCAGLDLKELSNGEHMMKGIVKREETGNALCTALQLFDRPVIGAINGVAITGGFELALACDILIASRNARFADTHARVGIIPGSELSQKLSRMIGIYRAMEVSLTGNFIDAATAADWGLVNRVVEPEDLIPACRKLADDILSCPPDMIVKYKKLISDGFHMTLAEGIQLEKKVNIEHFLSVKPETVAERREGILDRGRKQKH